MTDWESDPWRRATDRDPRTEALFVVGLAVVAANSALYFFGVESLSHPVATLLGVALLLPLYFERN